MFRLLMLMLALACAGPVAPADPSGTWKVTMEGEKKPIEGTLVLRLDGHELTGTWSTIDEWTMKGRADDTGRFALESPSRPVPVTDGGKKSTISARWIIRGAMTDGALSGTASIEFGDREPRIRRWSAVRK